MRPWRHCLGAFLSRRCGRPVGVGFFAVLPMASPASSLSRSALRARDALLLKLRAGAGPFRCLGNDALEPRPYQLVPLLMALKQEVSRVLIADEVGLGKTVEALLIAR